MFNLLKIRQINDIAKYRVLPPIHLSAHKGPLPEAFYQWYPAAESSLNAHTLIDG